MSGGEQLAGQMFGFHRENPACRGHPAMMLADYMDQPPPSPTPAERGWQHLGETEDGAILYIEPTCPQHGRMSMDHSGGRGFERWVCHGFDGEGCAAGAATDGGHTSTTGEAPTARSAAARRGDGDG